MRPVHGNFFGKEAMARKHIRPEATQQCQLVPLHEQCWECGKRLWVASSGEVLLARSLLSASEADLAVPLREVQDSLPVPIRGVVTDGQHSIRNAVQTVLPDVPHQLCH